MCMITRIHYLGLVFFSVLIFAVHGMPAPRPEKPLKYFVTIIKKDFVPVLDGVTRGTKQRITRMIKNVDLPGHENIDSPSQTRFNMRYNTEMTENGAEDFQVPGYHQMIRIVVQGGTACNTHPCFGWIWEKNGVIVGSIFSLSADSNGHQDWDRHSYRKKYQWDTSETGEVLDVEKLGENSIIEFENAQGSWLTKWSTVTELKVKQWQDKNPKSAQSRSKSAAQLGEKLDTANPSSGHLLRISESSGHRAQANSQLNDPFKFSGYRFPIPESSGHQEQTDHQLLAIPSSGHQPLIPESAGHPQQNGMQSTPNAHASSEKPLEASSMSEEQFALLYRFVHGPPVSE
ncbi:hypothetical protein BDP27DRAFT_1052417 [Rhodocollybia butyracea]|uniref:Uncharacterized protein n=1 Tax=Rhodocollybia butyracea TaxID=206335 RepID=A0A9P5PMU6_9AGAR|nr:hypothetical protein BDP27DRAFT_1052417 [Rhodocollybia butyracea]